MLCVQVCIIIIIIIGFLARRLRMIVGYDLATRNTRMTAAQAPTVAHRLLSSVIRINDDIHWPVHSLVLSLHDLRGLPCSMKNHTFII